jgi:hypothetical protein
VNVKVMASFFSFYLEKDVYDEEEHGWTKGQIMIDKPLHRKLKIEQHEPYKTRRR